jgi:hypothetical protein
MRTLVVGVGALTLALLAGRSAAAQKQESQETGLATIHAWVKMGRKTCMADHFHDGSGNGPTRAKAESAAIRSWVDFTAWEYGNPWGRYSVAAGKKMTCSQDGGTWTCGVEARPCRPY